MKNRPVLKLVGVVVFGLLVLFAIRYIDTVPSHSLLAVLGFSSPSSSVSPTSTPSPSPAVAVADLPIHSLGTVAIQSFNGSTLVRTGSGSIVSSDGLIVTTAAVAPIGSNSYVYQVATADGELLRARAVWRASGLVLLQVAATDLRPVLFQGEYQAGTQGIAVGAIVSLSKYTPLIVPAAIAYIGRQSDIGLVLDRNFASMLAGARVVDGDGHSLGLVQNGNYPRLIPALSINAMVDQYLAKNR
jgi:hypothetical protein